MTVGLVKPTDPPSFSLTGAREITGRIKIEKLEPVFRSEKVSQTRKYVEQFMTMVNVSLLNFVQMALLYRKDVSWRGVEKWA